MTSTIFYFTGTGNSLYAAQKIAGHLGRETKLVPLTKHVDRGFVISSADCAGIVFPVYAWGPPLIVKRFISSLTVEQCRYFFITATYGGTAGNALGKTQRLLKKRNISCNGMFEVMMPSNYIVLYDPPDAEKQKHLLRRADGTIIKIAETIRRGKEVAEQRGFISRVLSSGAWSLFSMGAHRMGRNFTVTDDCTGCGICERICPVNNIQLDGTGKPGWLDHCEQCVACIHWCPEEAIQYKSRTKNRTRYHHPDISVKEMEEQTP